jgi:hypothetical protein
LGGGFNKSGLLKCPVHAFTVTVTTTGAIALVFRWEIPQKVPISSLKVSPQTIRKNKDFHFSYLKKSRPADRIRIFSCVLMEEAIASGCNSKRINNLAECFE